MKAKDRYIPHVYLITYLISFNPEMLDVEEFFKKILLDGFDNRIRIDNRPIDLWYSYIEYQIEYNEEHLEKLIRMMNEEKKYEHTKEFIHFWNEQIEKDKRVIEEDKKFIEYLENCEELETQRFISVFYDGVYGELFDYLEKLHNEKKITILRTAGEDL